MSRLYVNDYLSTLNQQISGSVDRIKYKSGRFSADNVSSSRESFENTERYQSLNGYAYRLLETGMSYRLTALNSRRPPTPVMLPAVIWKTAGSAGSRRC